jgi:hypothetical protein
MFVSRCAMRASLAFELRSGNGVFGGTKAARETFEALYNWLAA